MCHPCTCSHLPVFFLYHWIKKNKNQRRINLSHAPRAILSPSFFTAAPGERRGVFIHIPQRRKERRRHVRNLVPSHGGRKPGSLLGHPGRHLETTWLSCQARGGSARVIKGDVLWDVMLSIGQAPRSSWLNRNKIIQQKSFSVGHRNGIIPQPSSQVSSISTLLPRGAIRCLCSSHSPSSRTASPFPSCHPMWFGGRGPFPPSRKGGPH